MNDKRNVLLNQMAKVVIQKKDKQSSRKQKEPKPSKLGIQNNNVNAKKTKRKVKNVKKKLTEKKPVGKKNGNKKEAKKRCIKNNTCDKKTLKSSDTGQKKKPSQKNNIIKNNGDLVSQPSKLSNNMVNNCDGTKLVNGISSAVIPQATRNPWVLKLDISPQRPSPVANGISSNGALALCNKSVIFIPKQNPVSSVILNRGHSLPFLKKDELYPEKPTQTSKQLVLKSSPNSNKEILKRMVETDENSLLGLEMIKKGAPTKYVCKDIKTFSSKNQKTYSYANGSSKASSLKIQKMTNFTENKQFFTEKSLHNLKDQKFVSKDVKNICFKDENSIISHQIKNAKTDCAKFQKPVDKEKPKSTNSSRKKVNKMAVCKDPPKMHSPRMASLDAMAKMHIICTNDRRSSMEVSRAAELIQPSSESTEQHSSVIKSSKKVQVGFQKETQEFKEHVIHSRINCIKLEEASVSERTENVSTFCSISSKSEQTVTKRPRGRPRTKPLPETPKAKVSVKKPKKCVKEAKPKKKTKVKEKKKETKKYVRPSKKVIEEKVTKKTNKKKESKSKEKPTRLKSPNAKVNVKTIRMRKTCTYQSVTTVSSCEAVDSVVSSCSRLGVTTNIETKKTVVTDQASENEKVLMCDHHQAPFMPILENDCHMNHTNCCKPFTNASQQSIPFAHSQSCYNLHDMEKCSSSQPHFDKGYAFHNCAHQPHAVYSRPSHDLGCCCSSSSMQSMPDMYLMPKEGNPCHHFSHSHLNSAQTPGCSCCYGNTALESRRCHEHFNLPSASYQNRWRTCYQPCPETKLALQENCSQCPVISLKSTNSSVPCDQTPLDLSKGSSVSVSVEYPIRQARTHCLNPHCCQDFARVQMPSSNCHFSANRSSSPGCCATCWNQNSEYKEEKNNLTQVSSGKAPSEMLQLVQQKCVTESMPFLSSSSSHSIDEEVLGNNSHHEIATTLNYSNTPNKKQCSSSLTTSKKKKFAHGWSWEGEPTEKMLALTNDSIPALKKCYPAMKHEEGDIIKEWDCVLLKSGPKDTDLPYVAKVSAFWENADDGEMMMSLLWYYRPEHTEQGKRPGQMDNEVFASKHRDVNSVACIEDKCYVLTFNEYCRYRSKLAMVDVINVSAAARTVPELDSGYSRLSRIPTECVSPDMIFFCRHVYDFRQKRILKNPV